jgi:hypothetical protein
MVPGPDKKNQSFSHLKIINPLFWLIVHVYAKGEKKKKKKKKKEGKDLANN